MNKLPVISREEVIAFRDMLHKQSLEILKKKGSDYNRKQADTDSLFNLKVAEILGVVPTAERGILVRLSDKLMRLISLLQPDTEAAVSDESVMDTVLDIHNYVDYALLFHMKRKEQASIGKPLQPYTVLTTSGSGQYDCTGSTPPMPPVEPSLLHIYNSEKDLTIEQFSAKYGPISYKASHCDCHNSNCNAEHNKANGVSGGITEACNELKDQVCNIHGIYTKTCKIPASDPYLKHAQPRVCTCDRGNGGIEYEEAIRKLQHYVDNHEEDLKPTKKGK